MRGNTRCPPRRHVILVGRDVPGAPRTRGCQRRRQRGRGPPGTSAPTRDTREHNVPRQPCYYGRARRPRRAAHTRTPAGTRAAGDVGPYQGTREHKVPHDANHVIMVGRDVPGAPRTRRRQRGRGPPGTSAPTRIHGNTRCRMMMLCVIIGICSFSLESNRVPQNRICPRPHPIGSSAFAHHFILNAKLHGILALPPSSRL